MVRWLHPAQLVRTGMDALVAAVFGARADHRLIEAVARPQAPYFDYSEEAAGEDFWLDYVADTGRRLGLHLRGGPAAGPARARADGRGRRTSTPHERGRVLVFGGDEVYPGASRETYEERTVQPYETAMRAPTRPPGPLRHSGQP